MLKINKKESDELNVRGRTEWRTIRTVSYITFFYFQGSIVHKFDIFHKGVGIGTVKVAENVPAHACLQIINKNASQTIVRSFKIGEFAVSLHHKIKS